LLQPVEALSSTEIFLKVPQSGTFKKISGFYNSAKRCTDYRGFKWHREISESAASRHFQKLLWVL